MDPPPKTADHPFRCRMGADGITAASLNLQTLARLLGGEVRGRQVLAPGPGHSAADRSLSIKLDAKAPDSFVVYSFAGDNPIKCRDYVREKAQLPSWRPNGNGGTRHPSEAEIEAAVLRASQAPIGGKKYGPVIATYNYTDQHGVLLYQQQRHEPKTFSTRRPDGNGGWINNLNGVERVLYRWPELLAYPDGTVFFCEGEKDADRVASLGHCATTVAFGSWTEQCAQALTGRDVLILEDNDEAGRKRALAAAGNLHGKAKTIRIVRLSDLPEGGDVSDWLDADLRRADKLVDLCVDTPEWAPDIAKPISQPTAAPLDARTLMTMTFQPIKYVVPGIIVEGLTLLAGKPKLGKSWLLLHAAVAVASNGFTLGEIHCAEGDVLYCALEDNMRRLQSRLTKLLGISKSWPDRLHLQCEMPRLADGGLTTIKQWIATAEHPRLIIIDTLAMVRPQKGKDQTQYDADYAAVLELRKLATEHELAVVVVHHLRKQDADDPFDAVSGTLGLTGAPDSVLVLKYDRNGEVVLHGRGRDLVEIEKALSFNRDTCTWTIVGNANEVRQSAERTSVLTAMEEIAGPASANEIAISAELKTANVRQMLKRLVRQGTVQRCGRGKYQLQSPPTNPDQ